MDDDCGSFTGVDKPTYSTETGKYTDLCKLIYPGLIDSNKEKLCIKFPSRFYKLSISTAFLSPEDMILLLFWSAPKIETSGPNFGACTEYSFSVFSQSDLL